MYLESLYTAKGRFTGLTATQAGVATYTVGADDASFLISWNVLVTTATTHTFTVVCLYTDEGNSARTATLSYELVNGVPATSIANAAGTVPYQGIPIHIRCKGGTTIEVRSASGGTYTTVTYNIEARILQLQ